MANVYYHDYLGLDRLLSAQELESKKNGKPAHDEMLFIIVHQAYELWFKQILFEVEAVADLFSPPRVDEKSLGRAVSHLHRVTEIQKVLVQQINVLETMTPLDFLDFRDQLVPASGFQSWQFRILENRLGLRSQIRPALGGKLFLMSLKEREQKIVEDSMKKPSLAVLIEKWLERTPFLTFKGYDFWSTYRSIAEEVFVTDRKIIEENPILNAEEKRIELAKLKLTHESFETLFDENKYQASIEKGDRVLSHKALKAALFINLYRDEPILHLPFRLLTLLMDVDENITTWRYRHLLMVRRMIGQKIGTGGSSGESYLREGAEKLQVFPDLFALTTLLIPRSRLPELPSEVRKSLGFSFS